MNNIVETLMKLIEYKLPISQDLLILAILYCDHRNKQLKQRLINALQSASTDCLDSNNYSTIANTREMEKQETKMEMGKIGKGKLNMQRRHQQWFKQYLLSSNAWVMPNITKSTHIAKSDGDANSADAECKDNDTATSKMLVFYSVQSEKKNHMGSWNEIVNFEIDEKSLIRLTNVRQDDPEIGITPNYSASLLQFIKKQSPNYPGLQEYIRKGI